MLPPYQNLHQTVTRGFIGFSMMTFGFSEPQMHKCFNSPRSTCWQGFYVCVPCFSLYDGHLTLQLIEPRVRLLICRGLKKRSVTPASQNFEILTCPPPDACCVRCHSLVIGHSWLDNHSQKFCIHSWASCLHCILFLSFPFSFCSPALFSLFSFSLFTHFVLCFSFSHCSIFHNYRYYHSPRLFTLCVYIWMRVPLLRLCCDLWHFVFNV